MRKRGSERQPVEVKEQTSKSNDLDDLSQRRTKAIEAWMRRTSPTLSVDVLLCRPLDALLMALSVASQLHLLPAADLDRMTETVTSLASEHPEHVHALHGICRAAMNDRKRGLLKPGLRARPRKKIAASAT